MRTPRRRSPHQRRLLLPALLSAASLFVSTGAALAQEAPSPPPPSPPAAIAATPTVLTITQFGALPGGLAGVPLAYHGPDQVPIHLTNATNERGTLFHESASGWEVVCQMPCTTTVNPKGTYKLHNSDPFHFPSGAGSLDLVADIGSRRRNASLGWSFITLSVLGASASPFFFLPLEGMNPDGKPKPVSPNVKTIGEVVIGTSAALLVAGIVVLVAGPSTLLTTTSGQRIAKEPSVSLPGKLKLTASGIAF